MKSGAVILCSGGVDSSVCVAKARNEGIEDVHVFCVDYGQLAAAAEISASRKIAEHYGCRHFVCRVNISDWAGQCSLFSAEEDVEKSTNSMPGERIASYVPFRNAVLLSCGLSYADALHLQEVWTGSSGNSMHRDNTKEFIDLFRRMAAHMAVRSGRKPIRIRTPQMRGGYLKSIRDAVALSVPLELTMTCYTPLKARNGWKHCWSCFSCSNRKYFFDKAKVRDPLRAY